MIKLSLSKFSFEINLLKRGLNVKINLFEQFIAVLQEIAFSRLNNSFNNGNYKETYLFLFGNSKEVSPFVSINKKYIDSVSFDFIYSLIYDNQLNPFIEFKNIPDISNEDIHKFYRSELFIDFRKRSFLKFPNQKVFKTNKYYFYSKNKNLFSARINTFLELNYFYDKLIERLFLNSFNNDFILSDCFFSEKDLLSYIKHLLIENNIFHQEFSFFNFTRDTRLTYIQSTLDVLNSPSIVPMEDIHLYIASEFNDKSLSKNNFDFSGLRFINEIIQEMKSLDLSESFFKIFFSDYYISFSIQDIIDFKTSESA